MQTCSNIYHKCIDCEGKSKNIRLHNTMDDLAHEVVFSSSPINYITCLKKKKIVNNLEVVKKVYDLGL